MWGDVQIEENESIETLLRKGEFGSFGQYRITLTIRTSRWQQGACAGEEGGSTTDEQEEEADQAGAQDHQHPYEGLGE
jgi:hypothetical protein